MKKILFILLMILTVVLAACGGKKEYTIILGGNTEVKVGESVNWTAKIDDLERKTDRLVDEYVDKRKRIIEQIDDMDDKVIYGILFARYIEQKTFERIAADMDYCFRQITRLHGKALYEFEKKYGHEYL